MKSAIVIGASRGIGRQIALTLARNNYGVIVSSKTTQTTPELPGSISTVVEEIKQQGGVAFPVPCDCRNEADIDNAVQEAYKRLVLLPTLLY